MATLSPYRFLHVPICQLTHPDHIEAVLVRNAANFHKSRDYGALKFFLGNGLLTNEGASWQSAATTGAACVSS